MKRLQAGLQSAWQVNAWWLTFLYPSEFMFRCLVWLRRECYRRGIFRSYRAPVPVVVVGNITLGGSGKTPVVIALLESLRLRGIQAGVVLRGYGADRRLDNPLRVDDTVPVTRCGDEARLIWNRTQAPVVVCADRAKAVQALLAETSVDIVLSDDGLQHYALQRDFEIILYDAAFGFGNGHCLPAGPLRESLSRLAHADYVLPRGRNLTNDSVNVELSQLVNLHSGEVILASPSALELDPYAVAGIGQPALFLAMLAEQGFTPIPQLFPDHHPYTAADFSGMTDRAIIMTEKDAVKCGSLAPANTWYARIEAVLPQNLLEAVASLAGSSTSNNDIERRA